EENAEEGVDQASDEKSHGEPGLRLGEEQLLDENDDALMQHEESSGEGEACCRVLGIEARADGGGKIANDGLGDAEEAERGFAEAVLKAPDDGAQKKSG